MSILCVCRVLCVEWCGGVWCVSTVCCVAGIGCLCLGCGVNLGCGMHLRYSVNLGCGVSGMWYGVCMESVVCV